jgi:hypothetical protein
MEQGTKKVDFKQSNRFLGEVSVVTRRFLSVSNRVS